MRKFSRFKSKLLSPVSALLAVVSAVLLILAFPNFDAWFLAWFALVPLFLAVEREKDSALKSFLTGWTFGVIFFFGSCWWLTFAPITYAHLPAPLVYFFLFCAASVVGVFPGIFASLLSVLLKRFGSYAILSAPVLWTFTEFLRMWLTGNNWNAVGYSQAFSDSLKHFGAVGGVLMVSFVCLVFNACFALPFFQRSKKMVWFAAVPILILGLSKGFQNFNSAPARPVTAQMVAIQPNVPMSGLTIEKYRQLLTRHVQLSEETLKQRTTDNGQRTIIVFPESPMIFQYGRDPELQDYLRDFAVRNNASVVFNSAELTPEGERILNSAVMIDERGAKVAQYDKIHLLPFGEYIPFPEPLASQMPAFVGNFEFGSEYDLLPFGEAKGGVMICFESHFGELSREYALRGADILVEMTNDGYLGNTPVLRQHLANSVFRAVETNRPLLRVTNVGVTAYINERGEVSDAADVYTEAARVWSVSKSDGKQTIYVKYGDWFAWLCSIVSLILMILAIRKGGKTKE